MDKCDDCLIKKSMLIRDFKLKTFILFFMVFANFSHSVFNFPYKPIKFVNVFLHEKLEGFLKLEDILYFNIFHH